MRGTFKIVSRLVGLLGAASLIRRILAPKAHSRNAAYAENQSHDSYSDIRDAGPEAMRDPSPRDWSETDEDGDESFPASDPPGGY